MDDARRTTGRCLCEAVGWEYRGNIPDATICNCTACRRYGVLWAYGHDGEEIVVDDPGAALTRFMRRPTSPLTFDFCSRCGSMVSWRGRGPDDEGRTRVAVNLRLADDPAAVAAIPLLRFDGLHSFEDLEPDGRVVRDVWF
jgi:hypothetical protein